MGSASSRKDEDRVSADDQGTTMLKPLTGLRMSTCDLRPGPTRDRVLLGTASFHGDSAYDVAGKFLGEIEELVFDIRSGRIAYAVMAVRVVGGTGRKMVAIPWSTISVDQAYQRCVINIDLERLVEAPSLDGDPLLRMADPRWATEVHAYFDCKPYWK